ncbi:MAG: BatA domain-containing protein [Candidatus Celaenobacter polaris]|nr:BatA domain-containing protein [Candidatus Celaenobacter polaris]
MNLSFLNSIFLIGLVAAIIPILIHLFIKYKPKIVYFSSLRFLKEVQKKKSRLLRLRELLLLITRILIIIFFILALARPVLKALLPKKSTSHAPTAIALILDNSFSMNYLEKENPIFSDAKQKAQEILELLNDKDRVMLVSLEPAYNAEHDYFTSPSQAAKELPSISISDNTQALQQVLDSIEPQIANADMINKEIYFITDEQRIPWKDIQDAKLTADLFVIPVGEDSVRQNISSVSARYVSKILSGTNEPVIQAVIKNNSSKTLSDVIVSLVLNNITRAETALNLNPYQSKQLTFEVPQQGERFHFGEVRVKDEMLPDDNVFYFNFPVQSKPKICVISSTQLPTALSSILDVITQQQWEQKTPQEMNEQIIENNQLFILYSMNAFDEKLRFYADDILQKGKAIFLIPDEHAYQRSGLQEWLIEHDIHFLNIEEELSTIDFVNRAHPICTVITEEHFQSADISRMWKVDAHDFVPLLSSDKGNPVLLIKDNLLLSVIDLTESWSNIIYQTVFPVLFYNIGYYLGDASSEITQYTVGNEPAGGLELEGEFTCQMPDGEIVPLTFTGNRGTFTQTDRQGHYFIYDDSGLVKVLSFNAPREESDLSLLGSAQKEQIMKDNSNIHFLAAENWKDEILTSRYGYEFWKQFLWVVLALLIIEMLLAYSGKSIIKK